MNPTRRPVIFTAVYLYFIGNVWVSPLQAEDLKTLRCCTLVSEPYTIKAGSALDGKGIVFDGLVMRYIQKLEMENHFRCSYVIHHPNNTDDFNALLEYMSNCSQGGKIREDPKCVCDVGIASWFPTSARYKLALDFVYPFIHDDYGVITHVDETSEVSNGFFFFTAFSPAVWGCICFIMVLCTFVRVLDKKYYPLQRSGGSNVLCWKAHLKHFLLKRMPKSALDTATLAVGGEGAQTNSTPKSTVRRQILNHVVTLIGLFLILSYEATMTASLVSEHFHAEYKDVNTLKECDIPHKEIGIARKDATKTYWNSLIGSKCPGGISSEGPTILDTYDDLMEALAVTKQIKYVLLDRGTAARYINGKYCSKLVFAGKSILRLGASIVLPKGSNRTKEFSRTTMMLNELGLLPTIDEFLADSRCMPSGKPTISFMKLRWFFLLAFLACVGVFIEMVVHPQNVHDQSNSMVGSQQVVSQEHLGLEEACGSRDVYIDT